MKLSDFPGDSPLKVVMLYIKTEPIDTENRWVVARGWGRGVGNTGKGHQKVRNSTYGINAMGLRGTAWSLRVIRMCRIIESG